MSLNNAQRAQLLRPLNSGRVKKRSNMSYLEAFDVKAHLTRIFGFGGYSSDVLSSELVFDDTSPNSKGKENHDVAYKVVLRLTIHGIGPNGCDVTYTEAAIGASHQPDRGEAHDMAVKTAESDALKRAAINLGTQFGLSLYANGATRDIIGRTLDLAIDVAEDTQQDLPDAIVNEDTPKDAERDTVSRSVTPSDQPQEAPVAENAAQEAQTDPEPSEAPTEPRNQQTQPPADHPEAKGWIDALAEAVKQGDVTSVMAVKKEITKDKAGRWTYQGVTLAKWADKAIVEAGKRAKHAEAAS